MVRPAPSPWVLKSADQFLAEEIVHVQAQNNEYMIGLLKLALKHAPEETKALLRRINKNNKIMGDFFTRIANEENSK